MPTFKKCDYCKHYFKNEKCRAFPNGILKDILAFPCDIDVETEEGRNYSLKSYGFVPFEHNKLHPLQDNDIIFEDSIKS